jgi:hypothetical protein
LIRREFDEEERCIGADARNDRYYWDGKIDDARIYDRALSAAKSTPSTAPPAGTELHG